MADENSAPGLQVMTDMPSCRMVDDVKLSCHVVGEAVAGGFMCVDEDGNVSQGVMLVTHVVYCGAVVPIAHEANLHCRLAWLHDEPTIPSRPFGYDQV